MNWTPPLPWDHPLADLVNPADYREWRLAQAIKKNVQRKEVTMAVTRVFTYDGRDFPDPDASLTIAEVKKYLGDFFPELLTAETREVDKDDKHYVEFVRKTGTKNIERT